MLFSFSFSFGIQSFHQLHLDCYIWLHFIHLVLKCFDLYLFCLFHIMVNIIRCMDTFPLQRVLIQISSCSAFVLVPAFQLCDLSFFISSATSVKHVLSLPNFLCFCTLLQILLYQPVPWHQIPIFDINSEFLNSYRDHCFKF